MMTITSYIIIFILLVIIIFEIFNLIVAGIFTRYLYNSIYSVGFFSSNGNIKISCNLNKTIFIYEAALICNTTDIDMFTCDQTCFDGSYNLDNVTDVSDVIRTVCDGKKNCSTTIDLTNKKCPSCKETVLIGKYDCIPSGYDKSKLSISKVKKCTS